MERANRKALAALALTGVGSALVVGFKTPAQAITPTTATASGSTTAKATATPVPSATPSTSAVPASPSSIGTSGTASTSTPAPSATSSTTTAAGATYADGSWTGEAVQEPWGSFQVQAVISGGQLTDVVLVSAPTDGHSSRINSQAVPILTQSAIAAQSAQIDAVSGATWTSQSYATSLQAALDQAKAAAQTAG